MLLLFVGYGNQLACHSQGRVLEFPIVVNRCICNGRIGMGEVTCLPRKEKGRATNFFRKKIKNTSAPPIKNVPSLISRDVASI